MTFKVEVKNIGKINAKLKSLQAAVGEVADEVQDEEAEALKEEVVRTSPVRSGTYQGNWKLEEKGDVIFLRNDTDYAKYLVYPNAKMRGSPKADKPSAGILHNVRGIVHKHKAKYESNMTSKIRSTLGL